MDGLVKSEYVSGDGNEVRERVELIVSLAFILLQLIPFEAVSAAFLHRRRQMMTAAD